MKVMCRMKTQLGIKAQLGTKHLPQLKIQAQTRKAQKRKSQLANGHEYKATIHKLNVK